MAWLLDTCAISETIKPKPDPEFMEWFVVQADESLFLSALTTAEIRKGILKLPQGRRRNEFEQWFAQEVEAAFADRILAFDQEIGRTWAQFVAASEMAGRKVAAIDGLIAATAIHYGLTLVTRNVSDFPAPVPVLNPWTQTTT